jgi:betaine-aldehyde dehydrogenase
MQAARAAFEGTGATRRPSERMGFLLKMADAIEEHAEQLVDVEAENTGKPGA